ncbi:hypothetical protein IC582_011482 [Cucumis melo]
MNRVNNIFQSHSPPRLLRLPPHRSTQQSSTSLTGPGRRIQNRPSRLTIEPTSCVKRIVELHLSSAIAANPSRPARVSHLPESFSLP